ncbi:MAG: hypothetical protein Q7I94_05715 [Candidatus Contubernalis sp.]|nr:hypothetical protein [Candidatus Contubernalis sp.]
MTHAPKHLMLKTRQWWSRYAKENNLKEPQLQLLTLAGEAWDRSTQARILLEEKGLTYEDRFGQPRPRPEVDIEKGAKLLFEKLMRSLPRDDQNLTDWLKNARLK